MLLTTKAHRRFPSRFMNEWNELRKSSISLLRLEFFSRFSSPGYGYHVVERGKGEMRTRERWAEKPLVSLRISQNGKSEQHLGGLNKIPAHCHLACRCHQILRPKVLLSAPAPGCQDRTGNNLHLTSGNRKTCGSTGAFEGWVFSSGVSRKSKVDQP